MLFDVISPPKRIQPAIISRIKVMSGLNIAEKRLPQDGRIRVRIAGRDIDIRVSTIPCAYGERSVLRLLDRAQAVDNFDLDKLGFSGENLRKLDRLIRQSHGIILATGPTGSGKSTTLYAALSSDQFAGKEHHYDRGSDRISVARRRPDAGQSEDRV